MTGFLFVLCSDAGASPPEQATLRRTGKASTTKPAPPLRRYLQRKVAPSARHLDHGVLSVGVAGGMPHRYRVAMAIGLLDHLTVGVTAHWLPGQDAPGWSPLVAIAAWRSRLFEVGATYHQSLHAPREVDDDPETPSFDERSHWILANASVSRSWVTAGFDVGMVRRRESAPQAEGDRDFVMRNRFGGGLHLRLGTRRFGFTVQGLAPRFNFEAMFDVRFGLFEMRRRGGWLEH